MMAVARAMSEMMKNGWKPRRSVLFVSWDGEEPGLLGSTEFVEDLTAELKAKVVVYVNRDAGAGGLNFSSSAVHSLTPFVHELAQSIHADGHGQDAVRRLARTIARAGGSREPRRRHRSARWDRDPTTPRFSITSASRRWTWG